MGDLASLDQLTESGAHSISEIFTLPFLECYRNEAVSAMITVIPLLTDRTLTDYVDHPTHLH